MGGALNRRECDGKGEGMGQWVRVQNVCVKGMGAEGR